ncbi:MAG: Mur ligase family protein, partial [Acetobacteraceae bacterium]
MTTRWTAAELVGAIGGRLTVPFDVTGVAIDTRTLVPGDLFVALRGEHRDGHAFVAAALARGAAGAMVAEEEGLAAGAPLLVVGDTLTGLAALGAAGRARFTGRLVAITGSVGKTTTKEMLRIILAAQAPTFAAAASHNNHWGVPLTLARLPAVAAFCIAELGMNHAGEIAPLARLARPQVAVITAIASAHIGHLGSITAIAEEKAAILFGLEPGGAAVLPADSDHLPRLRAAARAAGVARVVTFGADPAADVRLDAATDDAPAGGAPTGEAPNGDTSTGNVPIGNTLTGNAPTGDTPGTEVRASVGGEAVAFRLNAPGRHMALNALAALAAAVVLGVSPPAAARALAGFAPMSGRGARRVIAVPGGTALLLDESY